MDELFKKAMSDSNAERSLCNVLCTNFPLYYGTLQSQNILSYIYLRNMTNYLVRTDTAAVEYIVSHRRELIDLIYKASDKNFEILLSFYETLSINEYLWPGFYAAISRNLITEFPRTVKTYAAVFKRYEVLKATPQLHREISDNIDLLERSLFQNLLDSNRFSLIRNIEDILSIFYSLIYQDIHPYFENNMDKFFVYFNIIFDQHRESLCRIFSLCIAKYSDCVDIYKILRLCLSRDNMDQVLVQILKRKEMHRLRAHYDEIARYVLRKRANVAEFDSDPLRYTRTALTRISKDEMLSVLCNEEFKQAFLRNIPRHFRFVIGTEKGAGAQARHGDMYSPLPDIYNEICPSFELGLERIVDVCMALRHTLDVMPILARCSRSLEGQLLLFKCVMYLLAMDTHVELETSIVETHPHCAYIIMHYLTVNLEMRRDHLKLAMRHLKDEYSARLLFMIVRRSLQKNPVEIRPLSEKALGIERALKEMRCEKGTQKDPAPELRQDIEWTESFEIDYNEVVNRIIDFVYTNKEIGNTKPYFYLFDTLGLLISSPNHVSMLKLTNHILTNGLEELFHVCFYLLSLLTRFNFDTSGLLSVVRNMELWAEESLVFPLCCLTVSLISQLDEAFVCELVRYLLPTRKKAAYFLVSRSEYPLSEVGFDDIEEELFIKAHRSSPMCLDYFRENYVSFKNVRKVVKALCLLGMCDDDMVRKNLINYKDDVVIPYSICEEFGF